MKRLKKIQIGRPPNERFGASGAVARLKVYADLEVYRPSERQWKPRLPQAAGRWQQPGRTERADIDGVN